MRERIQTEEEDGVISNNSPVDSQVSSVEDVFTSPSDKMLYPFRVIEQDTLSLQSISSLGRVGRILSGNTEQNGTFSKLAGFCFHLLNVISLRTFILASDKADHQVAISPTASNETNILCRNGKIASGAKNRNETINFGTMTELPSLQEPDVIASTKNSNHALQSHDSKNSASVMVPPVAPPRRKKKQKIQSTQNANGATSSAPSLHQVNGIVVI